MNSLPAGTRVWLAAGVTDAQGLRQPGGAGADGARAGSVLWSRVLLPRPPWRSGQTVVVGWRWPVPVRQAAGARAIRLAACRGGRGGPEPGAIVDAARGDRLADAARTWRPELAG